MCAVSSMPNGRIEKGLLTNLCGFRVIGKGVAFLVETVSAQAGLPYAGVMQDEKQSAVLSRVMLQPGESKEASFSLDFDKLSFYANVGQAIIEATHYTVWVGESSLATEPAGFDVTPR